MGNYNPHAPRILGQEWVPILDTDTTFTATGNVVELGHAFETAAIARAREARIYVNEISTGAYSGQTAAATIYRAGTADSSGPVRSVVIPVNSVGVTGLGITIVDPLEGGSAVGALSTPQANAFISVGVGSGFRDIACQFNIDAYSQLLNGKRILKLELLYVALSSVDTLETDLLQNANDPTAIENTQIEWGHRIGAFLPVLNLGRIRAGTIIYPDRPEEIGPEPTSMTLGELNYFWFSTAPDSFRLTPQFSHWTFSQLRRLGPGVPQFERLSIGFTAGDYAVGSGDFFFLRYVALRVYFCEERRIAYGAVQLGNSDTGSIGRAMPLGALPIDLRAISDMSGSPALTPGTYDVAVGSALIPIRKALTSQFPLGPINSVRQLYEIPSHPGVQVNIPFPVNEQAIDAVITAQSTQILPQISLHTSGGTMLEPHVYGRQAVGQVYGSVTVTQEIQDGLAGGSASWPWVRYWARRFGDTTVPLTLTGLGTSVAITPSEFDAIDEIINGWKTVSLRFTTAPVMGTGTQPTFTWSATGELAGSRWEVLGAAAPAVTALPGNLLNEVASPQHLALATYGQPVSGSLINMGWIPQLGPYVSATVDDQDSDAAIIFAQDMPPVTGFALTTMSQAVSGIGQNCDLDPCGIPTHILYNQLTWGLPANTGYGLDAFNRTVPAGGWGSADVGGAYIIRGTAADYSVTPGVGIMIPSAIGGRREGLLDVNAIDYEIKVEIALLAAVAGTSAEAGIIGRRTGDTTYYYLRSQTTPAGATTIALVKVVAGVTTVLTSVVTLPTVMATGAYYTFKLTQVGTFLRGKVWPSSAPEPEGWMLEATDSDIVTGDRVGPYAISNGATGNQFGFMNLLITPPAFWFGYYELQRQDTVETDWQTIMKATGPQVTSFNDFEARIGLESSYRIRGVDVYEFAGTWSSTVTSTLPTPGVSGSCLDGAHILVFTSNERQDGSINLGYSNAWDSGTTVSEDFTFPESGFVQMQAMYDRDFFVAFRPLERGGEQFQRTLLVQAAAIAPESLADFRGLRDMAWDQVSYICVRDEDGNRWLASIQVPSGRVLRDRRLYLAPINVVEVTDTPSPVDP